MVMPPSFHPYFSMQNLLDSSKMAEFTKVPAVCMKSHFHQTRKFPHFYDQMLHKETQGKLCENMQDKCRSFICSIVDVERAVLIE